MSLLEIDRDTGEVIRTLGQELSDDIKTYFTTSHRVTEELADRALVLWDELQITGNRLACDCIRRSHKRPLLCAARPNQLRRMPAPPNEAHAAKCPFRLRSAPESRMIDPTRVKSCSGEFTIHGAFKDRNVDRERKSEPSRSGNRRSSLASVLFSILDGASINVMKHGEPTPASPCSDKVSVWAAAQTMCRDSRIKINLGDMLVASSESDRADIASLQKVKHRILDASEWPAGSRPQGYLCCIVDNIIYDEERRRFELSLNGWSQHQYIEARPHVFAEGKDNRRPPYIALISFAVPTRESSKAHAIRCYMQPCFEGDSWFPVDSGYERETLKTLLEWRSQLEPNISIDITKPLFDTQINASEACRPDFILSVHRGRKLICELPIETMGFDTIEYELSKQKTHPRMIQNWGHLVLHDMTPRSTRGLATSKHQFLSDLNAALSSILGKD